MVYTGVSMLYISNILNIIFDTYWRVCGYVYIHTIAVRCRAHKWFILSYRRIFVLFQDGVFSANDRCHFWKVTMHNLKAVIIFLSLV